MQHIRPRRLSRSENANTSFSRIQDVVILIGIIGFGIAVCALAQAQTTRGGYQGARAQTRGEYRGYTKGQDQGVTPLCA